VIWACSLLIGANRASMTITIRKASQDDLASIRAIHLEAFPEAEARLIAELAADLLSEESDPETVSLVAVEGDEVLGHGAFSPVHADGTTQCVGYILAPLAVKPRWQRRSIGTKLVESGLAMLSAKGIQRFLVYGDPRYYGRFGFQAEAATRFVPPYPLKFPSGWLALPCNHDGAADQTVHLACVEPLRNPALW
jgi:putative acetyltransferase